MKKSTFFLLVLSIFCVSFNKAEAQIPRLLNYQGVLADNTGHPVADGSHSVTFNLYHVVTGGTAFYSEAQTVQAGKGIFSATIGSQTPIPASIKFDSMYFLGISVDGGAELSPRTLLTAAPYALNSAFAANAGNASTATLASRATVADSAKALSAGVSGVVRSLNGHGGDLTIEGVGATKVTTSGSIISINIPPGTGNGIQGVEKGDSSIFVTGNAGPIADISVAPGGITNSKMASNAIATQNLQDQSVTASKISAFGATKNFVLSSDGLGNTIWQQPYLQMPYVALGSNPSGSVFTIASTAATGTAIRAITGSGAGLGIVTNAAIWGDGGTNYFGVVGFSDGGSSSYAGVLGTGNNSSAGVAGVAASGDAVTGKSNTGRAGFFQITNTNSSAHSLEASNAGSGEAIRGFALKDGTIGIHGAGYGQNSSTGVLGETFSASAGSNVQTGPTGIFGKASSSSPAAWSAGVRGLNPSTNGNGIGVAGYQAGSGWGVYGETPSGNAIYGKVTDNAASNNGVVGESPSPNGSGVKASYTGTGVGTPLQLDNGAIKVTGTNKAAFVHTVTNANKLTTTSTEIDNPLCNGDPNCILLITALVKDLTGSFKQQLGVYYDTTRNKWQILSLNQQVFTTPTYFNVWVVKQ